MEQNTRKLQVSCYYKFIPLSEEQLKIYEVGLNKDGAELNLKGLVILGTEGINSTYCGRPEDVEEFKLRVCKRFNEEFSFKDSFTDKNEPFHEFKVKIRDEICTLGTPDLVPSEVSHNHLSPEDWHQAMDEEDVVLMDTRNDYETEVGKFKGAIDPDIREFTEFPEYIKNSGIPKDKKVLIYCTGGIRCEKAILEMERQGYNSVFQLEGGILNYIKKFPNQKWEGECFVFDYRVAVDQNLEPTKTYQLCPHCGQPGKTPITCGQCGLEDVACNRCLEKGPEYKTCSKNCLHHFKLGHKTTRIHKDALVKRHKLP